MPPKGYKQHEETKEKIAAWNRGKKRSTQTKAKLSKALKEKWKDKVYRKKLIKKAQGRKLSTEHKKKISQSLKITRAEKKFSSERNKKVSKGLKQFWASLTSQEKTERLKGFIQAGARARGFFNTKIEQITEAFLKRIKVEYTKQKMFCSGNRRAIGDFYLPKFNLVLECDGEYWHSVLEQKQKDKMKDRFYHSLGLKVIRLSEKEIINNLRYSFLKKLRLILVKRKGVA